MCTLNTQWTVTLGHQFSTSQQSPCTCLHPQSSKRDPIKICVPSGHTPTDHLQRPPGQSPSLSPWTTEMLSVSTHSAPCTTRPLAHGPALPRNPPWLGPFHPGPSPIVSTHCVLTFFVWRNYSHLFQQAHLVLPGFHLLHFADAVFFTHWRFVAPLPRANLLVPFFPTALARFTSLCHILVFEIFQKQQKKIMIHWRIRWWLAFFLATEFFLIKACTLRVFFRHNNIAHLIDYVIV